MRFSSKPCLKQGKQIGWLRFVDVTNCVAEICRRRHGLSTPANEILSLSRDYFYTSFSGEVQMNKTWWFVDSLVNSVTLCVWTRVRFIPSLDTEFFRDVVKSGYRRGPRSRCPGRTKIIGFPPKFPRQILRRFLRRGVKRRKILRHGVKKS